MAAAELLKMTHSVDDKVKGVEGKVQDVRSDVHNVHSDVHDVGNKVQGVDDRLDQANRLSSLLPLLFVPSTHTPSQGTSSERIIYDGFRPRIHPPIITSHATLITTVQLNGFFKEVYSINGNPLALFCGYTGSVRHC